MYTERKKKRLFWLSERQMYGENKFCLDTSNLYPLYQQLNYTPYTNN